MATSRKCGKTRPAVITKLLKPAGMICVKLRAASATPRLPPPITIDPLSSCLNDKVPPMTPTTDCKNIGWRSVITSIGACASIGKISPVILAICAPQAPAQLTTISVSIMPASVFTCQCSPDLSIDVTVTGLRNSAPSAAALS